jgi:lipoprotein NlpI
MAATQSATPLIDYAADLNSQPKPFDTELQQRLTRAAYEIDKHPPPDADCAHTLGARRFATMFDDLGAAHSALGDYSNAVDAYQKALACNPRAAHLHAALASELLHLGRYADARAAAQRGLAIAHDDHRLVSMLAQLDFIEEHWTNAITNLRAAVTEAEDDEQATYWQCFLWLAQRRAGVRDPQLVARAPADNWPKPILESLQDKITEQELLDAVKSEDNSHRRREILSEALFYTGEQRLAAGHADDAKRYFTATTNLNVLYFIEHHVALAELAKLRATASGS